MSRPWMPLYVADYLADTGHLTGAEHGAYLLLIMHYWQKGGLPDDDKRLASIARASLEQWADMKPVIADFFAEGWKHPRIDDELQSAEKAYERRATAGRAGGKAKATGKQCSSNAKAGLKQSQPQLQATLNSVASARPAEDLDGLRNRLIEAVGEENIQGHGTQDLSAIIGLIEAGCDLDTDILPTIRAKVSGRSRPVSSWAYFTGAIRDAYSRRVEAGQGLAQQPKVSPIKREEDMTEDERRIRWGKFLNLARGSGIWFTWLNGPPPGRDGCRIPADMIEPRDLTRDWFEELKSEAA